ncbi:hypothetical protein JKA74_08760 [Marivirga sp. S37H4]|uniref:Uncharacterized protein n=1 Tax=Marivirga aurantiaca TaxID=2802615 RepID=A0A934WYH5_9BACT|nr:hypothetical protein [Marivirga aurantiaca]MBK6265126.1 hypothetical protein [Marivirga aurantiaca]
MKYRGLFVIISAIALTTIAYLNTTEYAILGVLLFFLLILGTSIYGMLKPKSEDNYHNRRWLVFLSAVGVFLLVFSRIVLMNYWTGFWELSNYLFYTSVVLFLTFVVVLTISTYKNKGLSFYNSSDAILLLTPLILFFLLELFHFKNSVSKESIDRVGNLRRYADIYLGNIIQENRDSLFIKTYKHIEEIENKLIEQSGGLNTEGHLVNGNDYRRPNSIVIQSGRLRDLEMTFNKLWISIDNKEAKDKINRIYQYILTENIRDNSVTEMLYRLSLFRLQLKNIELEIHATQHCI